MNPLTRNLTDLITAHSRIVVFSGAGISTESGISDYRSKGGIWDRFQPVTLQEFLQDEDKRKLYWIRKKELLLQMKNAKPNPAHIAIAQLESLGKLHGLITQNIDGLHQAAGVSSENIVELHGTNRETICLSCNAKITWQETLARLEGGEEILTCRHSRPRSVIPAPAKRHWCLPAKLWQAGAGPSSGGKAGIQSGVNSSGNPTGTSLPRPPPPKRFWWADPPLAEKREPTTEIPTFVGMTSMSEEACGGLLKPNTVSFGQALDPRNIEAAALLAESCDFMIVVGSTLVVEPAASFPRLAKEKGARLAIVNLTPTPLDEWANLVIHGKAGEVLPKAIELACRG